MSQRIPQKPKRRSSDFRRDPCGDVFTCRACGWPVGPADAGTQHRNHCPNCLSSVHLDDEPGDRSADCGGLMEPVSVWVRKGGEWAIIHRCRMRRADGAGICLGPQRRRVGHHPPLPHLWCTPLQPDRGR